MLNVVQQKLTKINLAYLEDWVQPKKSIYHTRRSEAAHMLTVPHYNYKHNKSFTHLSNRFFSIVLHDSGTHSLRLFDVLIH